MENRNRRSVKRLLITLIKADWTINDDTEKAWKIKKFLRYNLKNFLIFANNLAILIE